MASQFTVCVVREQEITRSKHRKVQNNAISWDKTRSLSLGGQSVHRQNNKFEFRWPASSPVCVVREQEITRSKHRKVQNNAISGHKQNNKFEFRWPVSSPVCVVHEQEITRSKHRKVQNNAISWDKTTSLSLGGQSVHRLCCL